MLHLSGPRTQQVSLLNSFAATGFFSVVARLGSVVGTLVFTALLSRHVGVSGFGEYAYALSIASICGALAMFGLDQLAIRDLSQERADPAGLFGRILLVQGMIAALCLSTVTAVAIRHGSTGARVLVLPLVLLHVYLELTSVTLLSLFRARRRMDLEAATTWLWAVVVILLTVAGIRLGLSLTGVLALVAAAYVARLGLIAIILRRVFQVHGIARHITVDLSLVRTAVPLLVITLMSMAYNAYPRLVVKATGTLTDVGLYAAAERVVQLLVGLFIVVDVVVFPLFAQSAAQSRQQFAIVYERVADAFLALGLVIGIACSAVVPEMLRGLFGHAFAGSTAVLAVLVPTISMGISGFVSARALISLRRERFLALWMSTMLVLGLPLSWWAAHKWQMMGVAWTWCVPIALGFVVFFVYIRTLLSLRWLRWRYALYAALFAGSFSVAFLLRGEPLWVRVVSHAVMAGVMVGVFFATGLLHLADLRNGFRSMPTLFARDRA